MADDKILVTSEKYGVTFDLARLKTRDMIGLSDGSWRTFVDVLARATVACPNEWGAPDSQDTWLDLPPDATQGVLNEMIRLRNERAKN